MPHWVQIELPVQGQDTGAMQIDLEKVKRTQIKRTKGTVVAIGFGYDGGDFLVENEAARTFLTLWNDYIELKHIDEESEYGSVEIARTTPFPVNHKLN